MARLKFVKNIIYKNTGSPYREGTIMTVASPKRIKELIKAGVAVEIKQDQKEKTN